MTKELVRYRRLERRLWMIRWRHDGEESTEEDEILHEMDSAWMDLSESEPRILRLFQADDGETLGQFTRIRQNLEAAFSVGKLRFCGALAALRESFLLLLAELAERDWVVHAKPPFGGPQQVIDYLGRYTHRLAISNQRLRSIDRDSVSFEYKDYRSKDRFKARCMQLPADEFIRPFLLHTLPPGFQRIRHYGLLASRNKSTTLPLCPRLLNPVADPLPSAQQVAACLADLLAQVPRCPLCHLGNMIPRLLQSHHVRSVSATR
jgi:hypothetical protein